MSRWFRHDASAFRHPKVAGLNDRVYRLWTTLLSVATENETEGYIPPLTELKRVLNVRLDHLSTGVEELLKARLLDRDGEGFRLQNWEKYQPKSDLSTGRVQAHRARKKAEGTVSPPFRETVSETAHDTKHTYPSSTNVEEGADIVDLDKAFWDGAKRYLGANRASLIGRWVRDHGKEAVRSAITAAQHAQAVDAVSYIERTLRSSRTNSAPPILC